MKTFSPLNLDCQNTVAEFIATYGTITGRRLANMLNLHGKGSNKKAHLISCYVWNKHAAIICREEGNIIRAKEYEKINDGVYSRMSEDIKW